MAGQGSPDWQRQVITSAQAIVAKTALLSGTHTLSSVPSGGLAVGFHGIFVVLDAAASLTSLTITGHQSGAPWGGWLVTGSGQVLGPIMSCPYESGIDSSVDVAYTSTGAVGHIAVYAVGDVVAPMPAYCQPRTGAQGNFVAMIGGVSAGGGDVNAAWLMDGQGVGLTVPVAPSSVANAHPPNELALAIASGQTATATIANAPGAGVRYRCWGAGAWLQGFPTTGTPSGAINGLTSSVNVATATCTSAVSFPSQPLDVPVGGLPTPTNTAVKLAIAGANGAVWGGFALLSTETV